MQVVVSSQNTADLYLHLATLVILEKYGQRIRVRLRAEIGYFPFLYHVQNSWVHPVFYPVGANFLSPVPVTDCLHLVSKLRIICSHISTFVAGFKTRCWTKRSLSIDCTLLLINAGNYMEDCAITRNYRYNYSRSKNVLIELCVVWRVKARMSQSCVGSDV
jgi:hypothetical protein